MTKIKDLKNLESLLRHVAYKTPEPIKTNFMDTDDVSKKPETRITMRPTVEEIMRQVAAGPVVRNERDQIVSIGKLRFSDGNQYEQALCVGPDGAVAKKVRMPAGAMLGCTEDNETPLGPGTKPSANAYVADLFKMSTPKYKARGALRKGRNYSREEARKMLAEAIKNTDTIPPTTRLPDSLPGGTNDIGACFVGLVMQHKGNGGSLGWEDMCSRLIERETYEAQVRALSDDELDTIERLRTAKNMEDIGGSGSVMTKYRRGNKKIKEICEKLGKF